MNKKIAVSGMWNVQTVADQGPRGMLPFPAGEYNAGTTYTATANVAPYVLLSGIYYVMNKVGSWLGTSIGKTPAQDYAANGVNATWIPFENYKAIYVELLMAKLGLIGKAVFYDEYMFSQRGTDANGLPSTNYQGFENGTFKPNLLLNFLTGDVELSGKLTAKENSQIAGMKVVGNSLRGVQAIMGTYMRQITGNGSVADRDIIVNNILQQQTYIFGITSASNDIQVRLPSHRDMIQKGIDQYQFEITIILDKGSVGSSIRFKCNDDALVVHGLKSWSSYGLGTGGVLKLFYYQNRYYLISSSEAQTSPW